MSTDLPTLTDEQIDAAYRGMYPLCSESLSIRRALDWKGLRAAFPAPTPPEPSWEGGCHYEQVTITLSIGGDRSWVLLTMPQADELDAETGLDPDEARDMAAALIEAADWIEANS